jgi:hypothetical protein
MVEPCRLPEPFATYPPKDFVAICHQLAGYEFPWELNRALELAVLRTFCVPRISQLLRATGEFVHRPQKRYDDTALIMGNILKWGYDSPQGEAAIARMNRIHQRFAIPNEDFLYVLSTTIYEPIRWNQRFGWRPFTEVEKQALFHFWREVGKRMHITDLPQTYEAFEGFKHRYEAEHFCYAPDNALVGNAVIQLISSWFPALAAPLVPLMVNAVIDEPMRQALGWSRPHPILQQLVVHGLRWGRRSSRLLPQRTHSRFVVDAPTTTYPEGYQIHTLGPDDDIAQASPSRCPFMRLQSLLKSNP